MPQKQNLKQELERYYGIYHRPDHLTTDPLLFLHRYTDVLDQEAVSIPAALLAYGNVKVILKSAEDAINRMTRLGGSPSGFIRQLRDPEFSRTADLGFRSFVHRFTRGKDLMRVFRLLADSWHAYGSLGAHFVRGLRADAPNAGEALDRLIRDWKSQAGIRSNYLLTAPSDGSCCKRWVMLLRWMGRKDSIDPGLWVSHGLRSDQLLFPLDTHTGRISIELGLTRRRSLGWEAVLEVTEALKKFDPSDPARFDFALCHMGKARIWRSRSRRGSERECDTSL
jgi:uncharacterized protein (TIGR02757 family)